MKKILSIIIVLLFFTVALTTYAQPDFQTEVNWGDQKEVVIRVNDKDIELGRGEPTPFIDENGRTQVPIRFVSQALGCKVDWDGGKRMVTITNDTDSIKLFIGKSIAIKNGENLYFDTVPFIKQDRTFVPVRFLSEVFLDANVDWDPETKLVSITIDKGLLIPSVFKEISEVLGENNVSVSNEVLVYSASAVPSTSSCDLYINRPIDGSDMYEVVIGLNNYETQTLQTAKSILKIFYPIEFEKAHSKLLETVNGEIERDPTTLKYQGIEDLYYDNRYYGSTKFEDGTCIYVGKVGVTN